jgi:Arc/MetJ family transcription regulator
MGDTVTITLDRELATKMVRPWYLIKKREADTIREAFRTAITESENEHNPE